MTEVRFVPRAEFDRLDGMRLRPVPRAELFATLCRINTLYMIARAGSGHIGSSFSSLDIVSWLYLNELRPGHDGRPKISTSRPRATMSPASTPSCSARGLIPFEQIHLLRRLGGLPGHPDVATPGIVTNTGPLGMGISKAKGMIFANRLQGRSGKVFVMTGDGELQEGQIWESLATAAQRKLGELTVHRGPQQGPVRHLRRRGQRSGRPGEQVRRVRLGHRALRRP